MCASNAVSMLLSVIFKIEAVKRALKIPSMTEYEKAQLKLKNKSQGNLITSMKESWKNQMLISEINHRASLKMKQNSQVAQSPKIRTFKTNPKVSSTGFDWLS